MIRSRVQSFASDSSSGVVALGAHAGNTVAVADQVDDLRSQPEIDPTSTRFRSSARKKRRSDRPIDTPW
jgi:hypothetical protein